MKGWSPGRAWDPVDKRENAREIMARNIDNDPLGRKLTPEARERAIEFAVDSWVGSRGNGEAAELGIRHVTADVIKKE